MLEGIEAAAADPVVHAENGLAVDDGRG